MCCQNRRNQEGKLTGGAEGGNLTGRQLLADARDGPNKLLGCRGGCVVGRRSLPGVLCLVGLLRLRSLLGRSRGGLAGRGLSGEGERNCEQRNSDELLHGV